jgi:TM2 domain-containing membrane protein YozV
MKKDPDQNRQGGDSKSDDRHVIECQMQVSGGEELGHVNKAYPSNRIRQGRRKATLDIKAPLLWNSTMSNGQGSAGNVIASLASFFIPGLGQLLQGRLLAAILFFVFTGILWVLLLGWIIHLWACLDAALWKPRS